ncbi:MAG TPA: helix-turn-helix domain-containing protein [Pseudonocardia sp.]|jgi:AcrR family transcriptional regulator|nr:helix-turn-helix domain-containing protein [Pseudonocardia sp.]
MPSGAERSLSRPSVEERRRQLVDAAREVFVEHGFAGARTRDIAGAAGTTETAMYRLFASKEQLFDAAICDPLEQLVLRMAALAQGFAVGDEHGRLCLNRAAQESMLETMIRAAPLFGAAVLTSETGSTFYQLRIAPLIDLAVKAVAEMLRGFPDAEIEPETLYLALFGIHMGLAVEANTVDPDLDVSAMAAGVVDLLSYGLVGP